MSDEKGLDTGKFRRIVHSEVSDAMDNAAMRLEAVRVTALMADMEAMMVIAVVKELLDEAVKTIAAVVEEEEDIV